MNSSTYPSKNCQFYDDGKLALFKDDSNLKVWNLDGVLIKHVEISHHHHYYETLWWKDGTIKEEYVCDVNSHYRKTYYSHGVVSSYIEYSQSGNIRDDYEEPSEDGKQLYYFCNGKTVRTEVILNTEKEKGSYKTWSCGKLEIESDNYDDAISQKFVYEDDSRDEYIGEDFYLPHPTTRFLYEIII